MDYRSLDDGALVSVLTVGCSRLGSLSNPIPVSQIRRTLDLAVDHGVNVFDTADIYGQGDSERELGRLLSRHRDIMIVTKAGYTHGNVARMVRLAKPALRLVVNRVPSGGQVGGNPPIVAQIRASVDDQDFDPSRLRRRIEKSLRRLRTDSLPAFLLHDPDSSVLVDHRVGDLMVELKSEGKIVRFGASVQTAEQAELALRIPELSLLQMPAALLGNAQDSQVFQEIRARGVAVFVRQIRFGPGLTDGNSVGPALRQALANPTVTSAILGISRSAHLSEALSAIACR